VPVDDNSLYSAAARCAARLARSAQVTRAMGLMRRTVLILLPFLAGVLLGPILAGGDVLARSFVSATVAPAPAETPPPPTPSRSPTPESSATPTSTATPTATPTEMSTPTPGQMPTVTPTVEKRASILDEGTLVTIYGRGFGIAPIVGVLGGYKGFDDMEKDVQKRFYPGIKANNGGQKIVPVVHLIYAMAMPCPPDDDCLLYLEGAKVDLVKDYIEPAQKRGWQVILDTQIGRSDPVSQVKRMIDKGYLKYENVHVALDPEFRSYAGRANPGTPIGTIQASQVNEVQQILDDYVRKQGLKHTKMLMVHQFGDPEVNDGVPYMVENKKSIKSYPFVDLVWDADGFGDADSKAWKYNQMLNPAVYPFIRWRGIKLFTPNPEAPNHYDKPQMDWEAAFGKKDTPGGIRLRWAPHVVVIA
jgi:hypothetical protein